MRERAEHVGGRFGDGPTEAAASPSRSNTCNATIPVPTAANSFVKPDRRTTVVIVDDQLVVRDGLAMLINSQADLTVIGQAGNGLEAIEMVHSTRPNVVLMDIRMPGMNGIEVPREITAHPHQGASTKVVILTPYDLDDYVFDALNAGASRFLLKHAPPEHVLLGVRSAVGGGALISPTITIRLIPSFAPNSQPDGANPAAIRLVTPSEREVFDHLVAGRTNAEIAADLLVGESTVKLTSTECCLNSTFAIASTPFSTHIATASSRVIEPVTATDQLTSFRHDDNCNQVRNRARGSP